MEYKIVKKEAFTVVAYPESSNTKTLTSMFLSFGMNTFKAAEAKMFAECTASILMRVWVMMNLNI